MDRAFMRVPGQPVERVTAAQVQNRALEGIPLVGIEFYCPYCSQPMNPAAMERGKKQVPHFRHQRNNEQAKLCEAFRGVDSNSAYSGHLPLPMYIRQRAQGFVVDGGFRSVKPQYLEELERGGAALITGTHKYEVTTQKFNKGQQRIPFDSLSLKPKECISLINAGDLTFESLWGEPADAQKAMLFSRDPDTNRGTRFREGDSIPTESDLFVLIPQHYQSAVETAFPTAKHLGFAGARTSEGRLQVFSVYLSSNEKELPAAQKFIEDCGMQVGKQAAHLSVLWPPSFQDEGTFQPIFEHSRLVVKSNSSTMCVHEDLSAPANCSKSTPSESSNTGARAYVLEQSQDTKLLSTGRERMGGATYAVPYNSRGLQSLSQQDIAPEIVEDDDTFNIHLRVPGCVRVNAEMRDKVRAEESSDVIYKKTLGHAEILVALLDGGGYVTLWEYLRIAEKKQGEQGVDAKSKRDYLLQSLQPQDRRNALARLQGAKAGDASYDARLARLRRAKNG